MNKTDVISHSLNTRLKRERISFVSLLTTHFYEGAVATKVQPLASS